MNKKLEKPLRWQGGRNNPRNYVFPRWTNSLSKRDLEFADQTTLSWSGVSPQPSHCRVTAQVLRQSAWNDLLGTGTHACSTRAFGNHATIRRTSPPCAQALHRRGEAHLHSGSASSRGGVSRALVFQTSRWRVKQKHRQPLGPRPHPTGAGRDRRPERRGPGDPDTPQKSDSGPRITSNLPVNIIPPRSAPNNV